MTTEYSSPKSLLGAGEGVVRSWVAEYIRMSRLPFTVNQLIEESFRVEGTSKGVTKTKVRKARRQLLSRR